METPAESDTGRGIKRKAEEVEKEEKGTAKDELDEIHSVPFVNHDDAAANAEGSSAPSEPKKRMHEYVND